MRPGEALSVIALLCFILLGWLRRRGWRRQLEVILLGIGGGFVILAVHLISLRVPSTGRVVGDWAPSILILLVYWQSGCFDKRVNSDFQNWLDRLDQRWIGPLLSRWERDWQRSWVGSYLELAYLLCSPLVMLGIAVLYFAHLGSQTDTYWTVVLTSAYLCYLMIPFIATLPPRLVHVSSFPRSKLQSLNYTILRHSGIQLNTFPSAHVAVGFAVSMVLLKAVPVAGVVFLIVSISIAAGAVLGRYHYLADVLVGAALSLIVCAALL